GSEAILLAFGGSHANGSPYVMGEIVVAGNGAADDADGVDVIDTDASNSTNMPIEAIETEFPLRMRRYALRRDSGGAGKFRGGLGCVREYEVLAGPITFTHRGERHYCPARGFAGGGAGAPARSVLIRGDGTEEVIPSKIVTTLHAGDRVVLESAGGGGWGPPGLRDLAAVSADVRNGKISAESAVGIYAPTAACTRMTVRP
ncbi:MAG TPA: hydantoinase B/oxoprolinase family protein, partial [Acetobacteraceae bacterium]|nr:hydantoinase B/oxoprolinase family protein [Acetobacteraceae bacterium]